MEHGQDDVISVSDRTSNEILPSQHYININKDFIACDPGINQKLYQKFENQRNDLRKRLGEITGSSNTYGWPQ